MLQRGLIFTIISCLLASGLAQESENPASLSSSPEHIKKQIPSSFEQIGSRYFYISRFARKNWFAAADTCRQIGGQLATIQSDEELAAISPHLKRESYWIDMNDLVANGKYVSWSTGKAATYFKWHPNQSEEKLNNEHCVDLFQAEMYYDSCFKKNLFICEAIEEN